MGRKTTWKTFSLTDTDQFRRLQSALSGLPAHHKPQYKTEMAGGGVCEIETNLPIREIRAWFSAADVPMPDHVSDTMPLAERVVEWEREECKAKPAPAGGEARP